ncbi:GNAT family N-acetyltransferase [Argonema antarcticum]|uniref:GNAT family N-acetyltransferase n=1 Tax=Argonema antarcticum TaxID=2942763 RepID=UPI002011E5DE|nr:GNAT family N-acetyltransferase [Argonema antarcticum]MCL1471685.1 GNAT family N-acetyltransferase [Argonema antarcticum A004/B2]
MNYKGDRGDMKGFIETERLILRQFNDEDADNLFALDNDPEVMRFINGGNPADRAFIQEKVLPRIRSYYSKYENYGIWAAIEKSSQDFMGWFHLYPAIENAFAVEINLVKDDEIALGYRLKRDKWGKGYATECSRLLVEKGFSQWGVQRVVAWALAENKASIRVMEKAGLKFEKEFMFKESQLPNLKPLELKAVMYSLDKSIYQSRRVC